MTSAVLLDTHVLLWALAEPYKLSSSARDILTDSRTDLWVSAASAFEISTKYRLGKLPGAADMIGALDHHLDSLGAHRLPIAVHHAARAGSLDWDHRDPFDRMLAAQSELDSIPLMSADRIFAQRAGVRLIPA